MELAACPAAVVTVVLAVPSAAIGERAGRVIAGMGR